MDPDTPWTLVQQRFADKDVAAWAGRLNQLRDSATRIGAAAHSVRAVPPSEALEQFASVVGARVVHAHVSEQPAENASCQLIYNRTPTVLLEERDRR